MIRSLVGTVNWQAPELWSPKPSYDYKVDVFSAGMVFWEMMSGWTGEKASPLFPVTLSIKQGGGLIFRNTPGKVIMNITSMMQSARNTDDLLPLD
jgi:serine/threonine protein kinase